MKKNIELNWEQLKTSYQPTDFSFSTTDDFQLEEGMINQDQADIALEFGLQLKAKGYNIYISGQDEDALFKYAWEKVEEKAKEQEIPDDLCYIYDFENQSVPKLVRMEHGDGKKFKDDMIEFKEFIINELPAKLESYDAERERQGVIDKLEDKKEEILFHLKEKAAELGFSIKLSKEGIGFTPVDEDGEPISIEAYDNLNMEKKAGIKKELEKLYTMSETILKELQEVEKIYSQQMDNIDEGIVLNEVGYFIKKLKENYSGYEDLQGYFSHIIDDIIDNLDLFAHTEKDDAQGIKDLFPWVVQRGPEEIINRYNVNLLVDNSELTQAPIITATNLSYSNLIGKIKIDTDLTASHTDFNNIRAGLLHQANGGYLIVQVNDLIEYPGAWDGIKRVLKTGKLAMENLVSSSITTTIGMTPEPIDIAVKVILVGSYDVYAILCEYDDSFKKLFKISVDVQDLVDSDGGQIEQFIEKIKVFCEEEDLPPVTIQGVIRLIEYSHRLAESKVKMSSNMQPIYDLIREATLFAQESITDENILTARRIKTIFKETLQKNMTERYEKNIYLVDVMGQKVGQINGLAVYGIDEYAFGRPIRITATTYRGKSGVVDVETAVGLSGNIHSKGVQIITGCLGNYFAKEFPLALSCRICFEQNYGGIDGDSASSAELYAVLSSLSEVPIRQGLAVTGSINQYGEIQPIGGINDKIEGFYRVCKKKGLTGNQGVIMPYQNIEDLVLEDEVIEAVKDSKFHIYSIKSFKQGMQLLTGVPYSELEVKISNKLREYTQGEVKMSRFWEKFGK